LRQENSPNHQLAMLGGIELTGYLANQNEMQFDQILLESAPSRTPYMN